jgi:hypothetical protein
MDDSCRVLKKSSEKEQEQSSKKISSQLHETDAKQKVR